MQAPTPSNHVPGGLVRRRPTGRTRTLVMLALLGTLAATMSFGAPAAVAISEGLQMDARVLLEGNARVGSWMAIEVQVRNDGPAISGELRLAGGAQGRTRFGVQVELPTQSNQTHLLYAQPPSFGSTLEVQLVSGSNVVATRPVAFTIHQPTRLVVGVIAEEPQRIVPNLALLPGPTNETPAIIALGPEDLPDRVEAWAPIDRLIWQDVDSNLLRPEQIAAMRGWLAGGGRLVIAGGTGGPNLLRAFPDEILPYRPTATVDAPAASLSGLLGQVPAAAPDIPALAGELAHGRVLAQVGDRVVAAEAVFGSGAVSLLGFDPGTSWIVDATLAEGLWRGLIPPRAGGPLVLGDDSQIVNAVSQLPSLALPPIGGLLALLAAYILLIGPINYLVLRRLDRREWAWVTMPALIAVFAAGSYGFGAALRGLDVIVNEVAIVRGAPDTTEGTAQVYLGVFSPSRGTYQVELPGGALLSATQNGEFGGTEGSLDVLQGNPSRIRDLVIGFGSLRTLRAETPAAVPRIQADLRLENSVLKGTIRNLSSQTLEKPAVVLGGSAVILRDLAPNAEQAIELAIRNNQFGQSLSDKIVGQVFFGDPNRATDATQRNLVRHGIIDQLTFDPNFGNTVSLPAESPVLLAWGTDEILDVRIQNQEPRRTGNVLYYIPLGMGISGKVAFEGDLLRRSTVEVDATYFNVDPFSISLGVGNATVAYRPIAFDGALEAERLVVSATFGGEVGIVGQPRLIEPVGPGCDGADCPGSRPDPSAAPAPCDPNVENCNPEPEFFDGLPEVELFDRTGEGGWVRLPHFEQGAVYEVKDAQKYVDPASGTVLVRFANERQDGAGFSFQVRIEGQVR
jgi:hypothetical protein